MNELRAYERDMQLRALSLRTIGDRLAVVARLARWLAPAGLLEADGARLLDYERGFAHLAPASCDLYVRHIQSFYGWALQRGLLDVDPSVGLIRPRLRRGRPHPTPLDDLRVIFACTPRGALRTAYTLAAFAGLRRGEVCRLRREDLHLDGTATADVAGKGGKARMVPLLGPVVDELAGSGLPRAGWLLTRAGAAYEPERLSVESYRHLQRLGVATTLHSMRHAFATTTYRSTRDVVLVQRLLGHANLTTTQIYVEPDLDDMHTRLRVVSDGAASLLGPRRLRAV
jgi:integrase